MLCRNFELIPIKFGFFMNFLICSKIRAKTLYYSTGCLAKFPSKMARREFSIIIILSDTYTRPNIV